MTSRNYALVRVHFWDSDIPAAKGTVRQSKVAVPGDDFPGSPANDPFQAVLKLSMSLGNPNGPGTRRGEAALPEVQNDAGSNGYSTAARRLRPVLRVRVRLVRARSPQGVPHR